MGKEIEVKILGKKYSFITDRTEKEAIEIATFVDEIGRKIKEEEPYSSENTIAILMALNIADKYFTLANEIEKLKECNDLK
ncbi:MAG: cell division protein ZapA [candidate division WOR-3 bacterium]